MVLFEHCFLFCMFDPEVQQLQHHSLLFIIRMQNEEFLLKFFTEVWLWQPNPVDHPHSFDIFILAQRTMAVDTMGLKGIEIPVVGV